MLARHGKSFVTFAAVGGLTAAVYFGAFWVLNDVLLLDYRIGVSIAYLFAVCFHFTANRNFTFRSRGARLHSQLARYAVVTCVNYLVTIGVVQICVGALGMSPYFGVLVAAATTLVSGYLLFRFWVFSAQKAGRLTSGRQIGS